MPSSPLPLPHCVVECNFFFEIFKNKKNLLILNVCCLTRESQNENIIIYDIKLKKKKERNETKNRIRS
jgi:hypothetical protein